VFAQHILISENKKSNSKTKYFLKSKFDQKRDVIICKIILLLIPEIV